jgi:hypothetical protein
VTVYWSTNDNADAAAWLGDVDAQSMEIGTYSNFTGQAVSGSVSSLTPNATYYYTMAATNGATNIWASPNVSFSTAALVITVTENGGNVDFAWNGIIGASGTTITGTTGGSADQIVPIDGQVQVANGHTNFSEGQWYAGTASAYGSGEAFSDFIVTCNIPFHVNPDGSLRVGKIGGDAGSTFPDLSTQVFTGSFSLPGTFATYGLFDTAGTSLITNATVPLFTATNGGGSIVFAAIPEPSAALLLGVAGLGLLVRRRRA